MQSGIYLSKTVQKIYPQNKTPIISYNLQDGTILELQTTGSIGVFSTMKSSSNISNGCSLKLPEFTPSSSDQSNSTLELKYTRR